MALGTKSPAKQTLIVAAAIVVFIWFLALYKPSELATIPPTHKAANKEGTVPGTGTGTGTEPEVLNLDTQPQSTSSSLPTATANPYITEGQLNPSGRPLEGPLSPPADDPWRPLILYAFSDTPGARDNLRFFLRHGLHAAADFIFILNGVDNTTVPELQIPEGAHNIRTVLRPNTCFDLGAYGEVLRSKAQRTSLGWGPVKLDLWQRYKRFIMLNASVRGPFLPHWGQGACWSDLFVQRVTTDTKLVGLTANCWPFFHVQADVWATDFVGMGLLMHPPPPGPNSTVDDFADRNAPVGLATCYPDLSRAVHAELGATRVMLDAGWKVDLMMSAFHGIANYSTWCNPDVHGDMLWNNKYFGTNPHPYETIFIKTNRDIDPVMIDRLTEWHWQSAWRSWDACGAWSRW